MARSADAQHDHWKLIISGGLLTIAWVVPPSQAAVAPRWSFPLARLARG